MELHSEKQFQSNILLASVLILEIMSNYANQYRLIRTVIPLLILIIAAVYFLFPSSNRDLVESIAVVGTVIEVNTGEGQSLRTEQTVRMTTARIRLANGDETRLLVQSQRLSEGDLVELIEMRYDDGRVRYRLK